ncbi:hypothetical protein CEXT_105131 [Caerostris extrusa]|uniref:Uncharacterized protein n=1 Tax=Caerostris extrusa TaxID=172846 RepID=A0AAV4RWQ1_CAEEX|nr:hypothetical protein CEXT_105131 [Caerostris extrusa]
MAEINDEFTTIYPTSDELSFDEFYCNLSYLNQANVSNESFCKCHLGWIVLLASNFGGKHCYNFLLPRIQWCQV